MALSEASIAKRMWHDGECIVKRCRNCGDVKPMSEANFFRTKQGLGGFRAECRSCLGARSAAWQRSPKGEAARAKYRTLNAERIKANRKKPTREQLDARNERIRQRRKEDPEHFRRQEIAKQKKKPELYRAIGLKHSRKIQNEPRTRLRNAISQRLRGVLKKNVKGGKSWAQLMGYTYQDLREHLERQFTKKMNWSNYGAYWHVDHIVPLAHFDFTKDEVSAVKACWAISNLRPLEATKNMKKRDKAEFLL